MAPKDKASEAGGGIAGILGDIVDTLRKGGGDLLEPIKDALEFIGNKAIGGIDSAKNLAVNIVDTMRGEDGTKLSNDNVLASNTANTVDDTIKVASASRAVEEIKYEPLSKITADPLVEAEKSNPISLAFNDLSPVGKLPENGTPQMNTTLPAMGGAVRAV